ncbi:hypothetical protein MPLB_1510060 [Mesorhizobium sp. ORS 3324]|nr:hypothetical protein MPLB_1510060 [Mesorhizobium sp. ORS 3324]
MGCRRRAIRAYQTFQLHERKKSVAQDLASLKRGECGPLKPLTLLCQDVLAYCDRIR